MLPREIWAYMVEIAPSAGSITHMLRLNTDFRELITEIASVPININKKTPFNYARIVINAEKYRSSYIIYNYYYRALLENNMQFVYDFRHKCAFGYCMLVSMIKYTKSRDLFKFNIRNPIILSDDINFITLYNINHLLNNKFHKLRLQYHRDNNILVMAIFAYWEPEYEQLLVKFKKSAVIKYAYMFGNYDIIIKYFNKYPQKIEYATDIYEKYEFNECVIKNSQIAQFMHNKYPNENHIYNEAPCGLFMNSRDNLYCDNIIHHAIINEDYTVLREYQQNIKPKHLMICNNSEFIKYIINNNNFLDKYILKKINSQIEKLENIGL
jgi:hypothetical protein